MIAYVMILLAFFLHVIEDFHIQGILAQMKQASYWKEYGENYKGDWIPALLWHGFEWSVFISLPYILTNLDTLSWFALMLIVFNGLLHSFIDHLKCNEYRINLMKDQCLHIAQILGFYILVLL